MRVVISGGSNSIRKQGWTADLLQKVPAGTEIVNISVGASTSTMGAWRVMTAGGLQPGDTLIWEYAVNDRNHVARSSVEAETLLRHVEHVLADARQAGARVLAVILVSLNQARKGDDAYTAGLRALLGRYAVETFDATQPLPGGPLRKGDFDDPNHVAIGGQVVTALVEWVLRRLETVQTVTRPPDGTGQRARRLVVLDGLVQETPERFQNGLLDIPAWSVPQGPTGLVFANSGLVPVEVLGLVILAHRESGILSILAGGKRDFVATAIGQREKRAELLRFLSFEATIGREPVLAPGEEVRLAWSMPFLAGLALSLPGRLGWGAARLISALPGVAQIGHDLGFARQASSLNRNARGSRIAAVLAETL